jgi:hypothetical protein
MAKQRAAMKCTLLPRVALPIDIVDYFWQIINEESLIFESNIIIIINLNEQQIFV